MDSLLVINPNTSPAVTGLLQRHAQSAAGSRVQVQAVTARFGAPYIACEASYAVAGHAVLDAWAAARNENAAVPRAVLIGCFGDPGLWALRESSPAPVTGLAEAAFAEASQQGRFAVVTGGLRWRPMLQRLAQALGHGEALAAIHAVAPSGAELAADPDGALVLLAAACREAASKGGVRSVILGGAGLAGVAARIQPMLDIPVIDSVLAGTRHALTLAAAATTGGAGSRRAGFDVDWQQLSPEMTALGRPGP